MDGGDVGLGSLCQDHGLPENSYEFDAVAVVTDTYKLYSCGGEHPTYYIWTGSQWL